MDWIGKEDSSKVSDSWIGSRPKAGHRHNEPQVGGVLPSVMAGKHPWALVNPTYFILSQRWIPH
jgi:hypothetical protein